MAINRERELKPEEQIAQTQIIQALTSLGQPWLRLGLQPPSFSVKEVTKTAQLSSNRLVIDLAKKSDGIYPLPGYEDVVLSLEDFRGNRLNGNIDQVARRVASFKRAANISRFESRPPGGGPIVKKKLIRGGLEETRIKIGKDKLRVRMSTAPDDIKEILRQEVKQKQAERALRRFGVQTLQDQSDQIKIDPESEKRAIALGLSVAEFIRLRQSVNTAYKTFVDLGPFYGKDVKGLAPTFRISAEPIRLVERYRDQLQILGQDIFALAKSLSLLPDEYRKLLGDGTDYRTPFTFRIDSILSNNGEIKVNEVQIFDGADALMMAEQIAYGLIPKEKSTAAYMAKALARMIPTASDRPMVIGWLRDTFQSRNIANSSSDTKRMAEFISDISNRQIIFKLIETGNLSTTNWRDLDGVINYAYLTPDQLYALGLPPEKLLCAGDSTVIGSKGVFAFLFDERLTEFFTDQFGIDRLTRLRERFIETQFITSADELTEARNNGRVVKVYASDDLTLLDRSRGVFGPWNRNNDWDKAGQYLDSGSRFISQEFIEPARLTTLLRANGGRNLERVNWYNRFCVKYVVDELGENVVMTAVEATLGPKVKPAGKDCSFTAVAFDSIIQI